MISLHREIGMTEKRINSAEVHHHQYSNHTSGTRLLHQCSPVDANLNQRASSKPDHPIITRLLVCSISGPRMIGRLIVLTAQFRTRVPVCSINVPRVAPRVLQTPWIQFAHTGSSATSFVGTGWHRAWCMFNKTGKPSPAEFKICSLTAASVLRW